MLRQTADLLPASHKTPNDVRQMNYKPKYRKDGKEKQHRNATKQNPSPVKSANRMPLVSKLPMQSLQLCIA
jgi:hypothetical protein